MARILIVDDMPQNLEVLAGLLAEWGHETVRAGDGVEGFEVLQKENPDLVLSDIQMPNRDGFELCRLIKSTAKYRKVPVILVTAQDPDVFTRLGSLSWGPDGYTHYPIDRDELRGLVDRHLG